MQTACDGATACSGLWKPLAVVQNTRNIAAHTVVTLKVHAQCAQHERHGAETDAQSLRQDMLMRERAN